MKSNICFTIFLEKKRAGTKGRGKEKKNSLDDGVIGKLCSIYLRVFEKNKIKKYSKYSLKEACQVLEF